MYADSVTPSMEAAIRETERRRGIQKAHNAEHGIVPKTIVKPVADIIEISTHRNDEKPKRHRKLSPDEKKRLVAQLTREMKDAAKLLEFEHAAYLRDKIKQLKAK
jgi:excinuclease ABC subunit B